MSSLVFETLLATNLRLAPALTAIKAHFDGVPGPVSVTASYLAGRLKRDGRETRSALDVLADEGIVVRGYVPMCEGRRIRMYASEEEIPARVPCDLCDDEHPRDHLETCVVYVKRRSSAPAQGATPDPLSDGGATLTFDLVIDRVRPPEEPNPMPTKVFISYTHDSDEHKERVLALAQKLRVYGLAVSLDRFVTTPPRGWAAWMEDQVRDSVFVLVVCTDRYLRAWEGTIELKKGAKWECFLTRQEIYDNMGENTKFVPVLLDGATEAAIPRPLSWATHYALPAAEEGLLRYLTGQPEVVPRPLGKPPVLPPKHT